MAGGWVEFGGQVKSFAVKDGKFKLVVEGTPKPGTLDGLVELSFAESLEVRIRDPQVRLEVIEGSGGFTYPVAGADEGDDEDETPPGDALGAGGRNSGRSRRS